MNVVSVSNCPELAYSTKTWLEDQLRDKGLPTSPIEVTRAKVGYGWIVQADLTLLEDLGLEIKYNLDHLA